MNIKKKGWIWWLQGPWRRMNTVVGETLWYWEIYPSAIAQEHCAIHVRQQSGGLVWHWFKYLLCWPLFRNWYRWRCEEEAYRVANHCTAVQIDALLGSYKYGWIGRPK